MFQQLGLPTDKESIDHLIGKHEGINNSIYLHKASYWNEAQRAFLKEAIIEGAEWSAYKGDLSCFRCGGWTCDEKTSFMSGIQTF